MAVVVDMAVQHVSDESLELFQAVCQSYSQLMDAVLLFVTRLALSRREERLPPKAAERKATAAPPRRCHCRRHELS